MLSAKIDVNLITSCIGSFSVVWFELITDTVDFFILKILPAKMTISSIVCIPKKWDEFAYLKIKSRETNESGAAIIVNSPNRSERFLSPNWVLQ